jgi:hypothetical protein
MPSLILARTSDKQLVLLSAHDGSVTRVLATNVGGGIAASRDTAYFSHAEPVGGQPLNSCTSGASYVESIGLDGQHRTRIARGGGPSISPDAKQLAYLRVKPGGDCSSEDYVPSEMIVVRDLRSGRERTWTVDKPEGVEWTSWAPDNRHLVVTNYAQNHSGSNDIYRVLDTKTSGRLSDAPKFPSLQSMGYVYVLGELGDTDTVAAFTEGRGDRLVALDPKTGAELRTLYTFPVAAPGGERDPAYLPRWEYEDHGRLESDTSGRHLLWALRQPAEDHTALYVLSVGAAGPVKLVDDISEATWVPGSER